MCDCGSSNASGRGPFAEGKELVEFVMKAHGGTVAGSSLSNGGIELACHGCGSQFILRTFVQTCPECGGVHAVSPPRANDPAAVQFAGKNFTL